MTITLLDVIITVIYVRGMAYPTMVLDVMQLAPQPINQS